MEVAALSIRLLGAFEVRVGGQPMRRVRAHSVEWLLALLVLRHGRAVPRSWLAGTLWPENREARALHNLRRNLMELRQALGAEAARLRSPNRATLGLDLTGAFADLVDFDAAIAAGDEPSLQAAVALYRGPLLEGCVEEWVFPERASRAEACLQALETLADRAAERGGLAAALGHLAQAAALDPLRDSTQRRCMQALTAGGDLPAALLTYREHRLRLHRELNVEPDPETTQLFQALRSGARRGLVGSSEFGYPRSGWMESSGKVEAGPSSLPDPQLSTLATHSAGTRPASRAPELSTVTPLPRPLTALIGREQEVLAVVERVRACRLVTLVGGGGVGKTRLAIQAVEESAAGFPEGAAFIELAALADPALLPGHVAAALGVREPEAEAGVGPESLLRALCGWLTRHPVLMVLDNCEHLVQGVAALAHALLSACPALRILATSRQRLGLPGEVVWRVPSLPAPDPERLPADEQRAVEAVLSYPAVQLLVERAAAVRSGFRLGGREEAVAVARICLRLDGIPLALELAAARVGLLTLPQIAARLDDRFRLLTTGGSPVALPRQQTLRALIDWSYDLLPEAERALFCRLSVFAGGWTLEAAEAVCACGAGVGRWELGVGAGNDEPQSSPTPNSQLLTPDEVLDLLSGLEEKSLVLVELREGAIRYRMLETVREYAREKLDASGERAAVRTRHRDWYLQLAGQFDAAADGPEQTAWLARMEADLDNLRAALAWCQEAADAHPESDAAAAGLRLASALWSLWRRRGYLAEGLQWLEGALARGSQLPAQLRAPALLRTARLAGDRGQRERASSLMHAARQEHEKVRAFARANDDPREIADAVLGLAEVAHQMSDGDVAWSCAAEARRQMEALKDQSGLMRAIWLMAQVALGRGDRQTARPLMEELLPRCRALGCSSLFIHALGAMGHLVRDEGNYPDARSYYAESLALRRKVGYQHALAQSLEDLAVLAGCEGHAKRAARLLGAGEAFCETLGAQPPVALVPEYERTVAVARAALGEAAFAAAWAEGRALSLDEAVEYALEEG